MSPPLTPDDRDPNIYISTLSGDLDGDDPFIGDINDANYLSLVPTLPTLVERWNNSITVVTGYETEPNAILDGFTITGGIGGLGYDDSNDPWPELARRGGGIDLYRASATIKDCIFTLNSSVKEGGALYAYNSDPNIIDCNFVANYSENNAGALYLHGSYPLIQDCNFTYNAIKSGKYGGAAYCQSSDANFVNCTFESNGGGAQSGALHNNYSSPTFYGCRFINNTAKSYGGAVRNASRTWPYYEDCLFQSNYSNRNSGAMDNYYSTPTLVNCIFASNVAASDGGAIASQSSEAMLVNCLFNRNVSSGVGGAVSSIDTLLTVINNTFYGNYAPMGSGMACVDLYATPYPSEVFVSNSILWDDANEIYNANSSIIDVNYSDVIVGWLGGVGNIVAPPDFNDVNGVDDIPGNEDDDFRLKDFSPCIDAADNLAVPLEIVTDLGGEYRFMDDPSVIDTGNGAPPIVDMGAHEHLGDSGIDLPPVADAGPDQTVPLTSGTTALVTLDGSGSYDPSGNPLHYFWAWTDGEGGLHSATGISPIISLALGEYEIQLIVHNGTLVSEPDTVTITVVEEMLIEVNYLPNIIDRNNLTSDFFLATIKLTGLDESQLDLSAGIWLVPYGIKSLLAISNSDETGTTVTAFFNMDEVLNAITVNGNINLTSLGYTTSGGAYSGTSNVFIYN